MNIIITNELSGSVFNSHHYGRFDTVLLCTLALFVAGLAKYQQSSLWLSLPPGQGVGRNISDGSHRSVGFEGNFFLVF